MKNIKIKYGVREGSLKWFAQKEWTIKSKYSDTVVVSSDDTELVFRYGCKKYSDYKEWLFDRYSSDASLLDPLRIKLEKFVEDNENKLNNDNDIDIELKLG